MKIKVKHEHIGRFSSIKTEIIEVTDLIAAFRYCYDEQKKYCVEEKIRARTNGYSWTEGYFSNQNLVTFEVVYESKP